MLSFDQVARSASKTFPSLKSAYLEVWDVPKLRRQNPLAIPNKDDPLVRPHAHSPLARSFVEQLRRIYSRVCQAVLTGLVLTNSRVDPSLLKTCHWSVHPSGDLGRHKSWPTRRPFGITRRYRSRVVVPALVAQANRDIGPSISETPKTVTKGSNSANSRTRRRSSKERPTVRSEPNPDSSQRTSQSSSAQLVLVFVLVFKCDLWRQGRSSSSSATVP